LGRTDAMVVVCPLTDLDLTALPSKWTITRREFDRSFVGLPHRRYRDMKARTDGSPHKRSQSKGLHLLSKTDFVSWSLTDRAYCLLWPIWRATGYAPDFSPSIHRIDPSKGYFIGNMIWLPMREHRAETKKERAK
jgi:hypothetical protein